MCPALLQELQGARTLYLTTYSHTGKSGTVPIWFFVHQEAIYFCTLRASLKIRRIQQTGRVTIQVARRHGRRADCTASLLEPDTTLENLLLATYRRRYPIRWLWIGRRLRKAFAQGQEVIVRLTPLSSGTT
jgi:PPOX class probable F420-dependent enzyme